MILYYIAEIYLFSLLFCILTQLQDCRESWFFLEPLLFVKIHTERGLEKPIIVLEGGFQESFFFKSKKKLKRLNITILKFKLNDLEYCTNVMPELKIIIRKITYYRRIV